MSAQKNKEKPIDYLSRTDRLEKAFLPDEDYKELLELWGEAGRASLSVKDYRRRLGTKRKKGPEDLIKSKRTQFLKRLIEDRYHWRELILSGRQNQKDRFQINQFLEKGGDNPLNFLNLSGVAPYRVLDEIARRYERQVKLESLWRKFRSANEMKDDVKFAKKYLRMVEAYEKLLFTELWPFTRHVRDVKRVIRVVKNHNRNGPPWMTKPRGAPAKEEFCVTVLRLVGEANERMNYSSRRGAANINPSRLSDISTGEKALWGSITAILMAAFPDWFRIGLNNTKTR